MLPTAGASNYAIRPLLLKARIRRLVTQRMRSFRLLILAGLLAPAAAKADALLAPQDEIEAGYSRDALTNRQADWRSAYLDGIHRFEERHSVYGEVRETQRFNLRDREISGGYYHPFDATWTALVEASVSPDHNVLPKDSLFGQLQKALGDGWDIQAGLRRSLYNTAAADMLVLTGERYWGNYRAAYKLYLGKLQGSGAAPTHNGQISYYYTGRSSITFNFAKGRQLDSLGPAMGVLVTDVMTAGFYGLHWFARDWGISYGALTEHDGTLYSRKEIRIGVRHAF